MSAWPITLKNQSGWCRILIGYQHDFSGNYYKSYLNAVEHLRSVKSRQNKIFKLKLSCLLVLFQQRLHCPGCWCDHRNSPGSDASVENIETQNLKMQLNNYYLDQDVNKSSAWKPVRSPTPSGILIETSNLQWFPRYWREQST